MAPWSFYYYLKYGPNAWGGQYLRNVENENWPLLFLYSVQDNQMPHTYIDGIIDVKRTQNPTRLISSKKFQKSSHVSHFRKYPEEYKGKLEEFLCKLKQFWKMAWYVFLVFLSLLQNIKCWNRKAPLCFNMNLRIEYMKARCIPNYVVYDDHILA